MGDEQPPSNHASIGDHNQITNGMINQTITHQAHRWQPRWEPLQAEAQALPDALARDTAPAIGALPNCSRMPFAPHPHLVGRDQRRGRHGRF